MWTRLEWLAVQLRLRCTRAGPNRSRRSNMSRGPNRRSYSRFGPRSGRTSLSRLGRSGSCPWRARSRCCPAWGCRRWLEFLAILWSHTCLWMWMWLRWPLQTKTKENINIYIWSNYEYFDWVMKMWEEPKWWNWFNCCNFRFLPSAMMRRRRVMQYENWVPIRIFGVSNLVNLDCLEMVVPIQERRGIERQGLYLW